MWAQFEHFALQLIWLAALKHYREDNVPRVRFVWPHIHNLHVHLGRPPTPVRL